MAPDGLVDLQREPRLGRARIDADHRQTERPQFVPQPDRGRTGLEIAARTARRLWPGERGNRNRLRDYRLLSRSFIAIKLAQAGLHQITESGAGP